MITKMYHHTFFTVTPTPSSFSTVSKLKNEFAKDKIGPFFKFGFLLFCLYSDNKL